MMGVWQATVSHVSPKFNVGGFRIAPKSCIFYRLYLWGEDVGWEFGEPVGIIVLSPPSVVGVGLFGLFLLFLFSDREHPTQFTEEITENLFSCSIS